MSQYQELAAGLRLQAAAVTQFFAKVWRMQVFVGGHKLSNTSELPVRVIADILRQAWCMIEAWNYRIALRYSGVYGMVLYVAWCIQD